MTEENDTIWPPTWLPGKPVPPRKYLKFTKARSKTLQCIHPRLQEPQEGNKLWQSILREHDADRRLWLVEEEPHPLDTDEWISLNENIVPSVLLALERTCHLKTFLQENHGGDGIFSFANSLAHFLLNESHPEDIATRMPKTRPEVRETLISEGLKYPEIPKHKIMSRNKAAKIIQKNIRGWLVRKEPEIQEMRQFWKDIREQQFTKVELKDSKVVIKNRQHCPVLRDEEAIRKPTSYIRLLEEHLDALSVPESDQEEKLLEEEKPEKPEVTQPVCTSLGICDEMLAEFSKAQLEELVRIYSLHPELRSAALVKFMNTININKP